MKKGNIREGKVFDTRPRPAILSQSFASARRSRAGAFSYTKRESAFFFGELHIGMNPGQSFDTIRARRRRKNPRARESRVCVAASLCSMHLNPLYVIQRHELISRNIISRFIPCTYETSSVILSHIQY